MPSSPRGQSTTKRLLWSRPALDANRPLLVRQGIVTRQRGSEGGLKEGGAPPKRAWRQGKEEQGAMDLAYKEGYGMN